MLDYYGEKTEINCPLRLFQHAKHTFEASKRKFSHDKCTYVSTFADAGLCRVRCQRLYGVRYLKNFALFACCCSQELDTGHLCLHFVISLL
jgi:hypothetical protein